MNALNSIFVVLLVILIGFGAFGYLYNEYQDLRRENDACFTQVAGMQENMTRQDEQHQVELSEKDRQLEEAKVSLNQCKVESQTALDTCNAELQTATRNIEACNTQFQDTKDALIQVQAALNTCQAAAISTDTQSLAATQVEPSTPEQMNAPQLAAVAPEAIVLLATGIGGVVVIVGLIFRTKLHKLQDVPSPVQFAAAPRANPKQVTVKMNHQAYQGYLNYLKSAKK